MPQLARHDRDLLNEAGRHLGAAESLIAEPSLSSLVDAQGHIDTAVSVLSDALVVTEKDWVRTQERCTSALVEWEKACRTSGVRGELLTMLAAGAHPPGDPTLWVIEGFGNKSVGDIALVAFSAAWLAVDLGTGSRRYHCLWGPSWLLTQLLKNDLVRGAVLGEVPATRDEAEIAATFVEPGNSESPYQDIREAHRAAQAVLAA